MCICVWFLVCVCVVFVVCNVWCVCIVSVCTCVVYLCLYMCLYVFMFQSVWYMCVSMYHVYVFCVNVCEHGCSMCVFVWMCVCAWV